MSGHKSKPMKALHNLLSLPSSLTSSRSSSSSKGSIKFYNRDEPYYEFTNFYPAPVIIDDQRWPSTEHYFQAQKFVGTPYLDVIRGFSSAREAFQLSRNPTVSQWRRSDWDAVKGDIMLKALRCKFTQRKDLRKLLWETGDRDIIEHTTNDSYWADGGGPGKGLNKLGKLLMQVRDDIVAVCGPYKMRKASNESEAVSKRPRLKRSLSFSDLSAAGYTSKESSFSPRQATSVPTYTKPTLKRSSSFSQCPDSKSSIVPRHSLEGSGISGASISSKRAGPFYSLKQSTLFDYTQRPSKPGKSTNAAKATTTQPRMLSYTLVASSSSTSRHRSSHPGSRNPITHDRWY